MLVPTRDGPARIPYVTQITQKMGREDLSKRAVQKQEIQSRSADGSLKRQTVISLELLTVLVVAPLACLVCYDIAKKNPRANIIMTIIATAELYGGEFGAVAHLPLTQIYPGNSMLINL